MQCKILIADDEMLARKAIMLALPQQPGISVVAECSDGEDAIAKIREHLPDIIFLDIQMPAYTGFEVLAALPANYQPYLIIVSAHDNALKAYEHNAADYMLKPFTEERFQTVFSKAMAHWQGRQDHDNLLSLHSIGERLQQVVTATSSYKRRLSVKDGAKIAVLPCEDILFIEANGDYTAIHAVTRKYLHTDTLAALEATLDPSAFVRIHRSHIVNISCIKELISHNNGDYTVKLHTGHSLKLSRSYREQALKAIG